MLIGILFGVTILRLYFIFLNVVLGGPATRPRADKKARH